MQDRVPQSLRQHDHSTPETDPKANWSKGLMAEASSQEVSQTEHNPTQEKQVNKPDVNSCASKHSLILGYVNT